MVGIGSCNPFSRQEVHWCGPKPWMDVNKWGFVVRVTELLNPTTLSIVTRFAPRMANGIREFNRLIDELYAYCTKMTAADVSVSKCNIIELDVAKFVTSTYLKTFAPQKMMLAQLNLPLLGQWGDYRDVDKANCCPFLGCSEHAQVAMIHSTDHHSQPSASRTANEHRTKWKTISSMFFKRLQTLRHSLWNTNHFVAVV